MFQGHWVLQDPQRRVTPPKSLQCGKEQIGDLKSNLPIFNHCKPIVFTYRSQQPQQDGTGTLWDGFPAPLSGCLSIAGYLQQGLPGIFPAFPVGLSVCVFAWHKPLHRVELPALWMLPRAVAWLLDRYLLPFTGRIPL